MSDNKTEPFLDWLRFTLPYSADSFLWIDDTFGGRIPLGKGLLSYSCADLLTCGGMCAYSPEKKENRILVELSAKALWVIDGTIRSAKHKASQGPVQFIGEAFHRGAQFTRVDVALDDFAGHVSPGRVWDTMQAGEWISRFRSYSRITSVDRFQPERNGDTVYIGSRDSESFVRVYDKAVQAGVDVPHWVRVEFEFKKDRANELAGRIARGTLDLRNLIYYYVDFKKKQGKTKATMKGQSPKYWPTADWWLEFLKPTDKNRLFFPQYEAGLEEIEAWLDTQVTGALVLFLKTRGIDAFQELLDKGHEKFQRNKRYLRLEARYHEAATGLVSSSPDDERLVEPGVSEDGGANVPSRKNSSLGRG